MILREELELRSPAATASRCTTWSASAARASRCRPRSCGSSCPTSRARDVYVCGPPAMTAATAWALAGTGVPRRHVVRRAVRVLMRKAVRRARGHRGRRRAARVLRHEAARVVQPELGAAAAGRTATPTPRPHPPGTLTGEGPAADDPVLDDPGAGLGPPRAGFVDVRTLYLTGSDGAHQRAQPARRADPAPRGAGGGAARRSTSSRARPTRARAGGDSLFAAIEAAAVRLSTSWGCR